MAGKSSYSDKQSGTTTLSQGRSGKGSFFQPKSISDDNYEQQANAVADNLMVTHTHQPAFFKPSANLIQRKCAECEEEEKIQRKEGADTTGTIYAPPSVDDVIGSVGKPLDGSTQDFMESSFGYNFSDVQIHNDTKAHQSSTDINALAYTHGDHVVFGKGQYQPETVQGKQLLAHELTHVIQQSGTTQAKAIQRLATPPVVTPRGTNPGDCMLALCQALNSMGRPRSVAGANTIVDNWLRDTLACLHTNAPNSNASHQQEIVQNEERELQDEAASARTYITQLTANASGLNDFMEEIRRICERKQREIAIEFRYNIILDNSIQPWGYHPATDWNAIEAAFAGMPAEATWMNRAVLTFRRDHVNATQPTVAGETDLQTGNITIFDRGFGTAPFSRSRATGIPATSQTIQHEIGHVMVAAIPRGDYNHFFDNILHWRTYPWAWVTMANSPHASWQAERNALIAETGMTSAQLDAWLTSLPVDVRTNRNNRSYYRRGSFLEAFDTSQVPPIPSFDYAASNKDDYLSEVYTFCLSNPEFVHNNLPARQIEWLKNVVFHTPVSQSELMRLYALNEPQQTQFVTRASRMFTWEQIDTILQQVTAGSRARGEAA